MTYSYDRRADLSPPLGRPGGPCQIVRRIEDNVKNPNLQHQLSDKIEDGESLSNPDAAKIYDIESTHTKGLINRLYIGPHAQYRMDLRSVTIRDLKNAVMELGKEFHAARKSQDHRKLRRYKNFLSGGKLEYITQSGLEVVLVPHRDGAKVVTVYWKGVPNPRPPGSCNLRLSYNYDYRK